MPQLPPGFRVVQEGAQPRLPEGFRVVGREERESGQSGLTREQQNTVAFRNERSQLDENRLGFDLGMNPRNLLQAFNLNDEAAGLNARVSNIFRSEEDRLDPDYAAELERNRVDTMREETPVRAGAAEFMGAVPLGAVRTVSGGGQLVNWGRNAPMRTAAATGATGGAVAGAGEGVTPEERAVGGGIGGVIGAILGPATLQAIGLTGGAVGGIVNAVRGGASAPRRAAQVLERSGVANDIRANPDALSAGDAGDFVAERVGQRGRRAAAGVALTGGQAADVADDAIGRRAAGRAERVSEAASSATELAGGDGERRAVDALMGLDEVREAARPLFNQADEVTGRLTPRMREIIRNADRAGVNFRRADELAGRTGDARVQLSRFADDIDNLPDEVRLGDVRALARTMENEARRLNRAGEDAGELWNMARELRDSLGRQSPEYRQAAQMWRSAARDEEAFDIGARIFQPGARAERDLRRFVTGGATQSERRTFLAGIADAIERRTGNASADGNTASRLNTGRIRDRLRRFLGDDAAEELMQRIDIENRQARFETGANPNVGSQTALRQEGRDLIRRAGQGPVRRWLAEIFRNPVGGGLVRQGRDQVSQRIESASDETLTEVARFLFSQDDMANSEIAGLIMREAQRRSLPLPTAPAVAAVGQNQITSTVASE
jgi:hypothetical protein